MRYLILVLLLLLLTILILHLQSYTGVTTSTGNGPHAIGDTVSIDVEFDTAVTVTGVPTLTLETGGTDAVVTLTGGSGTTTLDLII